ncbi:hypothetical protein GCM10010112_58080 [Actinoplanes lobatus]|uniref:Uncharacterized protein n=1 Tax=Actinoplanes lobatus TaxID=113568 RepID=A0ABQ4AZB0_9ACTN|nr:hypothetical protein GCM10010112_58080 [Actinoplanes lobatus]GIE46268.1 hypothetical protein Alo02nite_91660 [Actinoplanes lobatus]
MVLGAGDVFLGGALGEGQHLEGLVRQAGVRGDHRMLRGLSVSPIEQHFDTILLCEGWIRGVHSDGTRP